MESGGDHMPISYDSFPKAGLKNWKRLFLTEPGPKSLRCRIAHFFCDCVQWAGRKKVDWLIDVFDWMAGWFCPCRECNQ
jgi:hypothetical protein